MTTKILKDWYFDAKKPGAFSGARLFHDSIKIAHPNITLKQVERFLR